MRVNHLLTLLSFICLLTYTTAFKLYVPANDEVCVFDYVYLHDKVVGAFGVIEGGQLDIDVKVLGPDSKTIYEQQKLRDGSFQFKSIKEGIHTLCFINTMSTLSGKLLSFSLYVGDALHKHHAAKHENLSPLENQIVAMAEGIRLVRDKASYYRARTERHHETVESTNSRVLYSNIIKFFVFIAIAGVQHVFIRRMFEKTRKI